MNNTKFYYDDNGNDTGPISEKELIELVKIGKISRETLIWRQGYEDWKKLSESEVDISFLPPPLKVEPTMLPTAFANLPTSVNSTTELGHLSNERKEMISSNESGKVEYGSATVNINMANQADSTSFSNSDYKVADTYIAANQSKFPNAKIPYLRDKLRQLPTEQQKMLHSIPLKDPVITLILSLLLGGLGVDRFYLGDIGLGILKFISCIFVIGILWAVIDIFLCYSKTKEHNFNTILLNS